MAATDIKDSKAPCVKRVFDLVLATLALILLAPVLMLLAVLIRTRIGAPVFFTQTRPGLGGAPFTMIKFRTMTNDRDDAGQLLPDELRLLAIGRWLRSTSLDELPELFNVIAGQMSLVGPRPLLMQYLPLYTPDQARRHEVRPGITGLAQVSGRNAITWDEKFALDVEYVETRTLWLDIRILARTLAQVLKRDGISAAGEATMPVFRGNGPPPAA